MRLYLDSCVLIYLIEENATMHPRIDAGFRARFDAHIALSEMTRLECRVGPIKRQDNELLSRFDRFLNNPLRTYIALSRHLFDVATELRAQHGLKTPDALHLAAALEGQCDELWTNDRRLERAAAGRIAIVAFD